MSYYNQEKVLGNLTAQERTQMAISSTTHTAQRAEQICDIPLESKHAQLIDYLLLVRHPWSAPLVHCTHDPIPCTVMREQFQYELPIIDFNVARFSVASTKAYGRVAAMAIKKPHYPDLKGDTYDDGYVWGTYVTDSSETSYATTFAKTAHMASGLGAGSSQTANLCCMKVTKLGSFANYFTALKWGSGNLANPRVLRTIAYGFRFTLLGRADTRQGRATFVEVPCHDVNCWDSNVSNGWVSWGGLIDQGTNVNLASSAGVYCRFPTARTYALSTAGNEYHWVWHPTMKADLQWRGAAAVNQSLTTEEIWWPAPELAIDSYKQMDGFIIFNNLSADEKILVEEYHVYEYMDQFVPGESMAHAHEQTLHACSSAQRAYGRRAASNAGANASDTVAHAVKAAL